VGPVIVEALILPGPDMAGLTGKIEIVHVEE